MEWNPAENNVKASLASGTYGYWRFESSPLHESTVERQWGPVWYRTDSNGTPKSTWCEDYGYFLL